MTATTVGFAIEERDRARLQHLADRFGGGNRSAFLRRAIDVMERYELAQRLVELQAYGEERLAAAGATADDIPALVERALTDPDPAAVSQAKLIVAGITIEEQPPRHYRAVAPVRSLRELVDEVR
jgi:hypothetical protein